jgi:hypothetical protein
MTPNDDAPKSIRALDHATPNRQFRFFEEEICQFLSLGVRDENSGFYDARHV